MQVTSKKEKSSSSDRLNFEPEAEGPGIGVHSPEGNFVRHGDIPAAKGLPASTGSGARACTSMNYDIQC